MWLANTGILRDVVNAGVAAVKLEVADGQKSVVARSVQGEFRLPAHPRHGKMVIKPAPAKFDP